MTDAVGMAWVRELIERNRYLVLSTTDGSRPWVAPIEYLVDDDLTFYFFSTSDARHVRDIEHTSTVAVAIFDQEQPDYSPDLSATLNGVQIAAEATKLDPEDYTDAINAGIEALQPPMPPYEVFKLVPTRIHVPRIEDGVNVRREVAMD